MHEVHSSSWPPSLRENAATQNTHQGPHPLWNSICSTQNATMFQSPLRSYPPSPLPRHLRNLGCLLGDHGDWDQGDSLAFPIPSKCN